MDYSNEEYQSDLTNPDMPHIKTRDRFQSFYDQCAQGPAKDIQYFAQRMDWIVFGPQARIIELGCCSGHNVVEWLTRYPDVHVKAVDVSQGFIDETRRRVEAAGMGDRVLYHTGFIEDLTGTYTDVVLTETLEHVQDPLPVLRVAWSMVDEGGSLWITVPSIRVGTYSHVRGINPQELQELLLDVGVKLSQVKVLDKVSDPGTIFSTRCLAVKD